MLKAVSTVSKTKSAFRNPLITLGTPLGGWVPLAHWLRDGTEEDVQLGAPEFSQWHERILGTEPAILATIARGMEYAEPSASGFLRDQALAIALEQKCAGVWGGIDERACWTSGFWAELYPDAQFLAFYEAPATMLATKLTATPDADPKQLLRAWRLGAERILRLVRQHRSRVLLVDLDEATAAPDRLLAVCAERFGIEFANAGKCPKRAAPDAVYVGLAEASIHEDRAMQALCAELEVSCAPLLEDADLDAAVRRGDALTALVHYGAVRRSIERNSGELAKLSTQIARSEVHKSQARRAFEIEFARLRGFLDISAAQAAGRVQQAKAEYAREREELLAEVGLKQAALEEVAQLREHAAKLTAKHREAALALHQRERELKATRRDLTAATQDAERFEGEREEHVRLRAELEVQVCSLRSDLEAQSGQQRKAQEENELLLLRISELEKALNELKGEADTRAQEQREIKQENELLLLQLHQVQEELEHYFLENQQLATKVRPSAGSLSVESLEYGEICDEAPYRHVNVVLRGLVQGERHLDRLHMRLVDHHGALGIVLFAPEQGAAKLISCWEESGQENGRPFKLFHPRHKKGQEMLRAMEAGDRALIEDLLMLIDHHIEGEATRITPQVARWGATCKQLRAQLQLPPEPELANGSARKSGRSRRRWLRLGMRSTAS
jgi:hypothetical protein